MRLSQRDPFGASVYDLAMTTLILFFNSIFSCSFVLICGYIIFLCREGDFFSLVASFPACLTSRQACLNSLLFIHRNRHYPKPASLAVVHLRFTFHPQDALDLASNPPREAVPGRGFEPLRNCFHQPLKLARLPFPPSRQVLQHYLEDLLRFASILGEQFF